MPTVQRPGAEVYYEVTGQGPPILLGHSLLCDGRMWDGVVPALSRSYRVINPDFRGHRHSTASAAYSLDDLADDWLAILDREGVERAALCGLSMGGMAAMRLALAQPDRVAGLALIDSNGDRDNFMGRLRFRLMAVLYRHFGLFGMLRRKVLSLMLGRTSLRERPEVVERAVELMRTHDRRQLVRAIYALVRRSAIAERLASIRCPSLILVGEEDLSTPVVRSRRLHELIHGSELEVIPEAGHLSALERPTLVAEKVLGFLERCSF